jgi:hypothetical protein
MTRDVIGLTDTECAHIASWSGEQVGRAIWKIGRRASHVVQTILHPVERRLFYTNERMSLSPSVHIPAPVGAAAVAGATGDDAVEMTGGDRR